MHATVQHFTKQVDGFAANATETEREHVGAQQHHRAHFGLRKWIADSAGVTANQIQLEDLDLVVGNSYVSQLAKAGVNAINDVVTLDDVVDHFSRRGHSLFGGRRDLDLFIAGRDRGNLRQR